MTVIGHQHIRKVETFDGWTVLAHPLPKREDRVYRRGGANAGVCFGSHDVRLAISEESWGGGRSRPAILMHHGGGRHVLQFHDSFDLVDMILAMPERAQYAMLYTIFKQADESAAGMRASEHQRWAQAHVDGRIRKTRQSGGRVRVSIETPFERDLRLGKTKPGVVRIDTATGEITPADEAA